MTKKLMSEVVVLVLASGVAAQQAAAPDIPFDVSDVIKMPADLYMGEVAGVALNSKKHIFVYTRTGADDGSTILEPRAARVFEFNADGTFVKEIGKNLYSKGWAHAVRIDRDDSIWLVDNGTDEIVPIASTPGSAASFSRSARYMRQTSPLVSKPGVPKSMVTTECG